MDGIIEYDDKHRCIHRKFDYGYEVWYKYDEYCKIIDAIEYYNK